MFKRFMLYIGMFSLSLLMSGCVVKQQVDVDYKPVAQENATEYKSVNLNVGDERSFVVTGNKHPSFIGLYRSGLGIPYDVNTEDNKPLAKVIEKSLTQELSALGFVKNGVDKKTLRITINKWRFEGYQNTDFEYDISIKVLDIFGKEIAEATVKNSLMIEGTFLLGAKGGVERDMPAIYKGIMQKIIKENDAIRLALQK
jgi:hypothetical protein